VSFRTRTQAQLSNPASLLSAGYTSFAYPYGNHNELTQKLVDAAGYRLACSIRRGNLHAPAELFRLKRAPVDEFTSLGRFRRRLSPLYDLTCRLQRFRRGLRRPAAGRENG